MTVRLLNQKLRLQAGIKNIFDVKQLRANNANGIHIEASNQQNLHWGRTFFAGVTWHW
jgi:outer membrane receptor for ferrienterochelin and colicin